LFASSRFVFLVRRNVALFRLESFTLRPRNQSRRDVASRRIATTMPFSSRAQAHAATSMTPSFALRSTPRRRSPKPRRASAFLASPSAVISDVATAVLKTPLILKRFSSVRCDVELAPDGAFTGKVLCVKVRGERWSSPRDLTCETIAFDVGECELDIAAALSWRGIMLKNEARGEASLVFDSRDFGNFLAHPLFVAASANGVGGSTFVFERSTARVNGKDGCLEYAGTWSRDGRRRELKMFPNVVANSVASVELECSSSTPGDDALERALERFFTALIIDLDGTELRYKSMNIDRARSRARFALDARIRRFPSTRLQF